VGLKRECGGDEGNGRVSLFASAVTSGTGYVDSQRRMSVCRHVPTNDAGETMQSVGPREACCKQASADEGLLPPTLDCGAQTNPEGKGGGPSTDRSIRASSWIPGLVARVASRWAGARRVVGVVGRRRRVGLDAGWLISKKT
jgi:hypothetical protein